MTCQLAGFGLKALLNMLARPNSAKSGSQRPTENKRYILLIDESFPITSDFGLIRANVDSVARAIASWSVELGIPRTCHCVFSWEDALNGLEPLSTEMRRLAIVPTKAGWSAVFQSGIAGSDPASLMPVLSGRLRTDAMRVCATPGSAKYAAIIWENYVGSLSELSGVAAHGRTICAANDGGRWNFFCSGEPFDFENSESYAKTRIKDRFTKEMLGGYLERFGLHPFDDSFYDVSVDRPAIIFERISRWDVRPPEFSLADVVEGRPWR